MPVKVRCPSCDKSLSAPDAARGKAIKCPGCQTKIRVPGGEGESSGSGKATTKSTARKKVAQANPDSADFLSTMDVSKAVDTSAAMCPKCGAEIPEDASECPECGVDPATGQLSASAKKRLGRKGPDPALFYSQVWKNSWSFATSNLSTVLRLCVYSFAFQLLSRGCEFMVQWCSRVPPKMFWAGFWLVAVLVGPGVVWATIVNTIRATVGKKSDMRDMHIDTFQNVALGIKSILWTIVFGFPLGLTVFMYPIAMIHMAMPVTKKGWMWFKILPIYFRHLGPSIIWYVAAFGLNLVAFAPAGAAGVVARFTILEGGLANPTVNVQGKSTVYIVVVCSSIVVLAFIAFFLQAFALLFQARVLGLIAYYFRDTLDLVTLIPEKQYVHREIKRDAFGNPLKTPGEKVKDALIPLVALLVIGATGFFIWHTFFRPK